MSTTPRSATSSEADLGFDYRVTKAGEVLISREGRLVTRLRGPAAKRFLSRVDQGDPQQLMARATGNYKRGNERR